MYFRQIILIAIILVFSSCDFISPENSLPQNPEILNTVIDYTTVDVYPLFRVCNSCDAIEKQNLCFKAILINDLEKSLNQEKIETEEKLSGEVFADILINREGIISVVSISSPPEISEAIPNLEELISRGISKLPEIIQPALKRGIPVNVQFRIPINVIQEAD